MKKKVYDNQVLKQHPLYSYSECRSTLNEISEKDYPGCNYFPENIDAIDVDNYEHKVLRPIEEEPTVDAAIGIADYNGDKISSERIQIIELKIDVNNTGSIVYANYNKKVNHSTRILTGAITIDDVVYFVFNNGFVAQARRRFSSFKEQYNDAKKWKAVSLLEFNEEIKFKEDITIDREPVFDMKSVIKECQKAIDKDNEGYLIDTFDDWKTKYYRYSSKNDIVEAKNIESGLITIWQNMMASSHEEIVEIANAFQEEMPDVLKEELLINKS